MKQLCTLILVSLIAASTQAQNYSGPESVEFDYARNRYLISNSSSHQVLSLQNGVKTIFATLSGTGPHGIEIVGDTLYCCNGASIKAFNLTTAALVYSKNLGATFLNGITHDPNGNLYISDFSTQKIYRLNAFSRMFNLFVSNTVTNPNGIIYDNFDGLNPRLVFCNWGANATVKKINLADSTVGTLTTTTLLNFDGICKGKHGKFYVSCWGSQSIHSFDSTFVGGSTTVITGLSNPADIFYNFNNDTLAVPNASNNTVSFHYLGTSTSISAAQVSNEVQIFPNPSNGHLTISTKNFFLLQKITVYNSLMQEMYSIDVKDEKQFEFTLPNLKAGMYFLQTDKQELQKFIVY